MRQLHAGEVWPLPALRAVGRGAVAVPGAAAWTHVQFRRFAGCPICSLHLRRFVRRDEELRGRGISEVIVFASSEQVLGEYAPGFPFPLVADPGREHYRRLGIERSARALLHPAAWLAGVRGVGTSGARLPERVSNTHGLPADFLVDAQGRVRACKYGRHADDQWSVDELLRLVEQGPV